MKTTHKVLVYIGATLAWLLISTWILYENQTQGQPFWVYLGYAMIWGILRGTLPKKAEQK